MRKVSGCNRPDGNSLQVLVVPGCVLCPQKRSRLTPEYAAPATQQLRAGAGQSDVQ